MDMNLNSMNNVYQKTSNGISKIIAKSNPSDTKKAIAILEQKLDKSDKVQISAEATQKYEIQKMTKSVMKDISALDLKEKIEDIKARIENNTYEVSPDKIADAIISRWTM